MNALLNRPKDRLALFRNCALQGSINATVLEKDFWVCFMLDILFNRNRWGKQLTFKGGTSLSKCFDLIHRFSEDIDLILDWQVLGYPREAPLQQRSKTQ